MYQQALTDDRRQELQAQFHTLRDRTNTPEFIGHALVQQVLTDAAAMGTLNGDRLELSFTVSVGLPRTEEVSLTPESATDEPIHGVSAVTTCTQICFSVPHVHDICVEHCQTQIVVVKEA
jgi:hypothetical protein